MKKNPNPWIVCDSDPDIDDGARVMIELQETKQDITTIYIKPEKCFYNRRTDFGYYVDDASLRPLRYKLID